MSINNTKPTNGGSMNVIENSDDVQKRIEQAGYAFEFEAMEATFSEERITDNAGGSNSSGTAEGAKKAGDYTKAGAKAVLAFTPLIPAIAQGPKLKCKSKENERENKEDSVKGLDEK